MLDFLKIHQEAIYRMRSLKARLLVRGIREKRFHNENPQNRTLGIKITLNMFYDHKYVIKSVDTCEMT